MAQRDASTLFVFARNFAVGALAVLMGFVFLPRFFVPDFSFETINLAYPFLIGLILGLGAGVLDFSNRRIAGNAFGMAFVLALAYSISVGFILFIFFVLGAFLTKELS